jgi:hypothetical protein
MHGFDPSQPQDNAAPTRTPRFYFANSIEFSAQTVEDVTASTAEHNDGRARSSAWTPPPNVHQTAR